MHCDIWSSNVNSLACLSLDFGLFTDFSRCENLTVALVNFRKYCVCICKSTCEWIVNWEWMTSNWLAWVRRGVEHSYFATWPWLGGCFGLRQEPALGSQSQVSVCDRAPALCPGFHSCPLGIVSAVLRWQRSGCRRTRRSSGPPRGGRSPAGLSGAPGFLRNNRIKVNINERGKENLFIKMFPTYINLAYQQNIKCDLFWQLDGISSSKVFAWQTVKVVEREDMTLTNNESCVL